ncbi:hypothetical protein F4782DRAFT_115335 [Xylaria castorea]|nr:hypothetical protein F4782DRAFT_115335 [Xylaria castorea]
MYFHMQAEVGRYLGHFSLSLNQMGKYDISQNYLLMEACRNTSPPLVLVHEYVSAVSTVPEHSDSSCPLVDSHARRQSIKGFVKHLDGVDRSRLDVRSLNYVATSSVLLGSDTNYTEWRCSRVCDVNYQVVPRQFPAPRIKHRLGQLTEVLVAYLFRILLGLMVSYGALYNLYGVDRYRQVQTGETW